MDHADNSPFEILNDVKASLSDCDELINILPNLTIYDFFDKEENKNVMPDMISLLLGQAAQTLPLQEVDRAIFQPFLPLVKRHLIQTLSSIHNLLQSETTGCGLVPEVTKCLEECVQILTDLESLLAYLISLDQVSVSDTHHVPINIADIIQHVFVHCQKSQEDYKEVFMTVRNELMCLFQKCFNVQVNLFALLNEKLKFNCTYEDELQLLLGVLDILSSMAEVVADLDTKSLVEYWKGYVQLTQNYATHLCSRLDIDRPINYLAVNINLQISKINTFAGNDSSDKKIILRSLKVTSLQLKVLIKICENYKGYLVDCHRELLNCLVSLVAHTNREVAPEVAAGAAQVSAGAAPLLSTLIFDPRFLKAYFEYADELAACPVASQVGYCRLTDIVLKKLILLYPKDEEIQELWFKPNMPVVENVLKILHQCSMDGGILETHEEDVYQALLVHTAAFLVATCSEDMFSQLERLLIRQLLEPGLWPAIFSSDLLCLIARFGSSELCLQLANLLSALLLEWQPWDWYRPEWVYVSWSLGRLVQLLAPHHLQTLPSRLPTLPSLTTDITTLLAAPVSDKTVIVFQSLMEKLMVVGHTVALLPHSDSGLAEAVCELWQQMSVPPELENIEGSHWFLGLFSALVTITSSLVESLNNSQINQIQGCLIQANYVNSSSLQCGCCLFLRSLATKTLVSDSDQTQVCHKMSSLFIQLLQKSNPLTKQIAFETFSFLAHITKYEQIVADTVANNCQLQVEITNYLEGVQRVSSKKSLNEYLKYLQHIFLHKCNYRKEVNEQKLEDSVENRPLKKLKSSIDEETVTVALQRIENGLDLIEEYNNGTPMAQSHISSLNNIYIRLGRLVK